MTSVSPNPNASVMKRDSALRSGREHLLEGHGPAEPQVLAAQDSVDAAVGDLPLDEVWAGATTGSG